MVEAVREAVRQQPLATAPQLCEQVSTQLGRTDLPPANIQTALEDVSCRVIRPVLRQQWEEGTFHPKEEVVLQEALTAVLSASSSRRVGLAEDLHELGIEPAITPEEMPVQRQQADAVALLLNPRASVEQVSGKIRLMVLALTLYYWNVPLTRLGQWFHVSPSTILNWVTGLAVALYPIVQGWIVSRTQAVSIALDEKWLKIRHAWQYWFVGLDEATGHRIDGRHVPARYAHDLGVYLGAGLLEAPRQTPPQHDHRWAARLCREHSSGLSTRQTPVVSLSSSARDRAMAA